MATKCECNKTRVIRGFWILSLHKWRNIFTNSCEQVNESNYGDLISCHFCNSKHLETTSKTRISVIIYFMCKTKSQMGLSWHWFFRRFLSITGYNFPLPKSKSIQYWCIKTFQNASKNTSSPPKLVNKFLVKQIAYI